MSESTGMSIHVNDAAPYVRGVYAIQTCAVGPVDAMYLEKKRTFFDGKI